MSGNKFQIYEPYITEAKNHPLTKAARLALGNNSMAVAEHYRDLLWEKQEAIFKHTTEYPVFLSSVIPSILKAYSHKNQVFSPFSLYIALVFLAALCDGETQEEILNLLDFNSSGEALEDAEKLLHCSYLPGPGLTIAPSASLWLDQKINITRPVLDAAQHLYSEIYRGDMGDPNFTAAMEHWKNQKTGRMLTKELASEPLSAETIMSLITTILFSTKWSDAFKKKLTTEKSFHSPDGDLTCKFMNKSEWNDCWFGKEYTAVKLEFDGFGSMWFALPNEGKTPADIVSDPEFMNGITSRNIKFIECDVDLSLPRFSTSCSLSLDESLKALGIQRVFTDDAQMPYTFTDEYPLKLDQVKHGAHVEIDEDGVKASSYTVMNFVCAAGIPQPPPKIKLVFDRPFLYWIDIGHHMPLFMGICNNPAE